MGTAGIALFVLGIVFTVAMIAFTLWHDLRIEQERVRREQMYRERNEPK